MPRFALTLAALLPLVACRDDAGTSASTDGTTTTSASTTSSSGGTTATSSDTGDSSTTGTVPCMGDEDCMDAAAPFCDVGSGECVACDETKDPDGACAGADPGLPVCAGGACVQCTAENPAACTGQTPICDEASNTCVRCTAHDQCGPAACNLFTGACLPADAVVHVGGATPDFDTLAQAVASFGAEMEGTIIVHAGMADYNEPVTVSAGRTIAFLAAELGPKTPPPRWIRTSGAANPQLTVGPGTTVLMDGLELAGNLSSAVPGVRVNGGRAWLDRSRVVQNAGGGIVAESGADLVLRNCFVGGNGEGGPGSFGIDINESDVRISHTTVARNDEEAIDSLRCTAATVDVRDSIVIGRDENSIECPGIVILDSAVDEDIGDNVNVGPADLAWFVDGTAGNFHLTAAGAVIFADIARWQLGDPSTDIDGDLRPDIDGSPDYAGADVPQ